MQHFSRYICGMKLNTVIFDMDGLLIDSEPLWKEAADELFATYGTGLSHEQYAKTTGLRTKEFLHFWFHYFNIAQEKLTDAEEIIVKRVIELVKEKGRPLPGVSYIFEFFKERNFNIGLATSSGPHLIEVVTELLGIRADLGAVSSANDLAYGKPHPEVYLVCAEKLSAKPRQCICFEDSFNGMIAAKAAGMKCVIVPSHENRLKTGWGAADLTISSLLNFTESSLKNLNN